jgi:hypothetical protein
VRIAVIATMVASVLGTNCSRRQQPAAVYVDSNLCRSCHAQISAQYSHTGMARSFYRPQPENSIEAYGRPFYHRASDTWYRMEQRKDGYYQRRWQIGYRGKEENVDDIKIDYVMGSGNHVRTYLHRTTRGTLIEAPLAWYSEKGGYWAMNPGYDSDHPPSRRKIGYDCMFCHNAYPAIAAGHEGRRLRAGLRRRAPRRDRLPALPWSRLESRARATNRNGQSAAPGRRPADRGVHAVPSRNHQLPAAECDPKI